MSSEPSDSHLPLVQYSSRINKLHKRLRAYKVKRGEDSDGPSHNKFLGFLKDACAVVREADNAGSPDLPVIVSQVDKMINEAVNSTYGRDSDDELFEYMPSFAHSESEPLLESRDPEGITSADALYQLDQFLKYMGRQFSEQITGDNSLISKPYPAWKPIMQPHPMSTRLSRFKEDLPPLSASRSTPTANLIYQARAEVSSDSICPPIDLRVSNDGSLLMLPSMGGYKNRDPMLWYYMIDDDNTKNGSFPNANHLTVPLSEVAYHSALDDRRKLLFMADSSRIKSYKWDHPVTGRDGQTTLAPFPVHTMKSSRFEGAMIILPNGRLVRGGRGSAGIWELDSLETHGPEGDSIIGDPFDDEDTLREDEVESSGGSVASTVVKFEREQNSINPAVLHAHPSLAGSVLCASKIQNGGDFSCLVLDFEHGAKTSGRFLGHGGAIEKFSTSTGDPNVFVSACNDGCARLYDVRHPLPVLTVNVGSEDSCESALIVHLDGIPTIFTGNDSGQAIKLWDVRARSAVYELATGNNSVVSMSWDATRNILYAATNCEYVDRMGGYHDYRRARIPKRTGEGRGRAMNVDEDGEWLDEDDEMDGDANASEDDDDDDDDDPCWPKQARHAEDYFGYTFDAGEARIYRYAFKENPNQDVMPCYGNATINNGWF